jgi:Co/Zn/Cd efflux system component
MNGNLKWIMGTIGTVIAGLIIIWLGWTSTATMANSTDIAVLKSQFIEIRSNIIDIKDTVREIRADQRRRELNEKK